ncbi:hypothetical protein ABT107_29095, partial [Streptomyces sp. NPDC002082]
MSGSFGHAEAPGRGWLGAGWGGALGGAGLDGAGAGEAVRVGVATSTSKPVKLPSGSRIPTPGWSNLMP